MPEIAPIIEPKIMFVSSVVEKSNVKPSRTENTKKETIVNPKPIMVPLKSPISLVCLSAQNVPRRIETPLIISTITLSAPSENPKNRKQNASASTSISDTQSATSVPRPVVFHNDEEAVFSIKSPFISIR